MLIKYSYAFIALPGGLGTLDEMFEALTLIQTGKIANFPIVLIGRDYWQPLSTCSVTWRRRHRRRRRPESACHRRRRGRDRPHPAPRRQRFGLRRQVIGPSPLLGERGPTVGDSRP